MLIPYYKKLLKALERYFNAENWKSLFMQGGCYWLADILHQGIPYSKIMINRMEEHCAVYFDRGLYDIRGKISQRYFYPAGEKEISFMKKNYIPHFNTKELERYLCGMGLFEIEKYRHAECRETKWRKDLC